MENIVLQLMKFEEPLSDEFKAALSNTDIATPAVDSQTGRSQSAAAQTISASEGDLP